MVYVFMFIIKNLEDIESIENLESAIQIYLPLRMWTFTVLLESNLATDVKIHILLDTE